MARFLAGAAACFLLLTGAFLLWQSRAQQAPTLPAAPQPRIRRTVDDARQSPSARSEPQEPRGAALLARRQEQGRQDRVRGDFGARRKAFAKLDANGNGALSFEEWAAKTIEKFQGADNDRNGWLTAAEYATTAPPPPKHPKCGC